MKLFILLLVSLGFVYVKSNEDDFLEDVTCNNAQDCYINDGTSLALACYYNVKKCKCMSTIQSDYHLIWNKRNKECLSSKYGPCGENGRLKVGCADGFKCIDKRCRDPKDKMKTVKGPHKFEVNDCSACNFSPDLALPCDFPDSKHGNTKSKCVCRQTYIADAKSTAWEIHNYDGDHICSVSQFGPCGEKNGVKIECHGDDMACLNGICTNPSQPYSKENQLCQETKNCEKGLICSYNYKCIQPKSSIHGTSCQIDEECAEGLVCRRNPYLGPWSTSKCYGNNEYFGPRPHFG